MALVDAQRKTARLTSGTDVLSMSAYNLAMGMVVLYGLLMNAIFCYFFSYQAMMIMGTRPIIFLIGYFVLVIAGSVIANKSDNPLISFLGYNMIVLPIGIIVSAVVGTSAAPVVMDAIKITAGIVLVMIGLSCIFPRFFLSLGKALFLSLIALIVASLVMMLLGISSIMVSYVAAGIFSLYIGFDIQRAQQYPRTLDNAVDCAIDIYLDVINLFLRILSILNRD